jgi:hypothetical protein
VREEGRQGDIQKDKEGDEKSPGSECQFLRREEDATPEEGDRAYIRLQKCEREGEHPVRGEE